MVLALKGLFCFVFVNCIFCSTLFLGDEFGRLCEGMAVNDIDGRVLSVAVTANVLLWRSM